jgi:hypothetical protein
MRGTGPCPSRQHGRRLAGAPRARARPTPTAEYPKSGLFRARFARRNIRLIPPSPSNSIRTRPSPVSGVRRDGAVHQSISLRRSAVAATSSHPAGGWGDAKSPPSRNSSNTPTSPVLQCESAPEPSRIPQGRISIANRLPLSDDPRSFLRPFIHEIRSH